MGKIIGLVTLLMFLGAFTTLYTYVRVIEGCQEERARDYVQNKEMKGKGPPPCFLIL